MSSVNERNERKRKREQRLAELRASGSNAEATRLAVEDAQAEMDSASFGRFKTSLESLALSAAPGSPIATATSGLVRSLEGFAFLAARELKRIENEQAAEAAEDNGDGSP